MNNHFKEIYEEYEKLAGKYFPDNITENDSMEEALNKAEYYIRGRGDLFITMIKICFEKILHERRHN